MTNTRIIAIFFILIFCAYLLIYMLYPLNKENNALSNKYRYKILQYKNLKEKFYSLKIINVISLKIGKHRLSTYLFTLLSFIEYLNRNGFKIGLKLKPVKIRALWRHRGGGATGGRDFNAAAYNLQENNNLQRLYLRHIKHDVLYFRHYKDYDVLKEIHLFLIINKIPGVKDYLFLFKVLRALPAKIESIKISDKNNFNSKIDLILIGN